MPITNPEIESLVKTVLKNEAPKTVLEISGYDCRCGKLIRETIHDAKVDRVILTDDETLKNGGIYRSIYEHETLYDVSKLPKYELIIIFHLLENISGDEAKALLKTLLTVATKQVFVITSEYPYDLESETGDEISTIRVYHPIFFLGMDFSYKMFETTDGNFQAYSFFPKMDYAPMPCDNLPDVFDANRKLKIAYIFAHNGLTGAMKVIHQQIKELSARGHIVSVYFRSNTETNAIPEWSNLTEHDVFQQIVIPEKSKYIDYIDNSDIIIISESTLVNEFKLSKIPAIIWEQGSPYIYGEYKDLIHSNSSDHTAICNIYRASVHFIAVSYTIQTILKEVYNRDAQYFPPAINTDAYYPLEEKNNEIPIILLVGPRHWKFKGLDFAISLLEMVYQQGIAFKVQWISQWDFSTLNYSFELEKIIQPPQERLAEIYRNADILLSTSLYESFPMPPIEAMASGTAVLAMDCGGINTYAEPGVNCLLCEQGDFASMFYALQHLLLNREARERLALAGRETALKFSFPKIIPILERCLIRIVTAHM